jgi:hypothetical protein
MNRKMIGEAIYIRVSESEIPLPSDGFLFDLLEPWDVRALFIRKTVDLPLQPGSAYFHVSWLSDFISYPKLLYKSLHQSFFYSFIAILPSESGATEESRTTYIPEVTAI